MVERNVALKQAALLRERIRGAVLAAPHHEFMSVKDIHEWPSVYEVAGKHGLHKVGAQAESLHKSGEFQRENRGRLRFYRAKGTPDLKPAVPTAAPAAPAAVQLLPLNVTVDKATRTIGIEFEGLLISVTVR